MQVKTIESILNEYKEGSHIYLRMTINGWKINQIDKLRVYNNTLMVRFGLFDCYMVIPCEKINEVIITYYLNDNIDNEECVKIRYFIEDNEEVMEKITTYKGENL